MPERKTAGAAGVEVDSNGNTIMHGCVKRWDGLMLWHKRIGGQK